MINMATTDFATTFTALGFIGLSVLIYTLQVKKHAPAPLPPGPKGLPLLGNIVDLPRSQPWVTFANWGEIYGGIVHVSALGQSIIVLNDAQYALDMLDKKGRLYSDRPTLMMAGRLVGWDEGPALIQVSNTWSEYRRLFAQFMGTRAKIDAFKDVLHEETHGFMKRVLVDPEAWLRHSRKFAGSIVLTLAYGYKAADDEDDRMVKLVDEAMDQFSETTASNAFLVDVFPILRYIPEWFPGAAWKKKVPKYRRTLQDMLNLPYSWAKQQVEAGTARSSFLFDLLDNRQLTTQEEHVIKWAAAGIYSGGADTTVAGIECFFLAMTLQVFEQEKARAEIDEVVGTDRLPTLADRERLPYFEALFTEVLRVYTFGPIGLPHVPREDDVHEGYFIPKGSIVFTNMWQFFKDPKTYAHPENFSPGRFIASEGHPKERDPRDYLFGFGRRACPGVHLADASMWLLCVSLIAAFSIRPPVKDGEVILPSGKYMDGSISHPEPFECVIKPRSRAAEALVRAA